MAGIISQIDNMVAGIILKHTVAERRCGVLERALEPFAKLGRLITSPDHVKLELAYPIYTDGTLTAGDLRRAAALIKETTK